MYIGKLIINTTYLRAGLIIIDLIKSIFPWAQFRKTKAAVSVYALVAIIKKLLYIKVCLYSMLQFFSLTVFETTSMINHSRDAITISNEHYYTKQLNHFD
jgi:hypothetical protein